MAIHPEPVAGDPTAVRWVMPAGTLPFVGAPAALPPELQTLVDDGTVTRVEVEPDAVRVAIAAGRSWRVVGGRVRSALVAALGDASAWRGPGGADRDDVLRMAVEQVIAGDVGDYVRGHGGRISLLDVRGGRVEVALGGACAHCPSSDLTLTQRFEVAVRARCPDVTEVVTRDEPGASGETGRRRLLPLRPVRRSAAG
ncbi:NifU family protein [Nocardioides rubriscoriae]|uniref:NifU family protein n=1 Tax=Nocardioides rubriscoriae TaxID=642762 RepID=UPI0011DFB4C9|nr:NifU family protein [Nocardioides rubriscoriae]